MATSPQDDDDVALLRRVVTRDHHAFERLYQRYTPRLTPYLRTLLGSQDLVEDVLHDVWLVVWQQATRYQASGRVASWLFGIARHKALKAHAQARRFQRTLPDPLTQVATTDPAHHLLGQAQMRLVQQALYTLPPAQREVVILTYVYDYPAQAIAALQDCALATVHYRLQQARRRLAATLAAWSRAPRPPSAARSGPPETSCTAQAVTLPCDLAHLF
jgi:RNA polymerase sigma-70 factor (ECF subfamily)